MPVNRRSRRTNVRVSTRVLRQKVVTGLLRAGFVALGAVAPGLAARWAEALFFTPPRPKASPHGTPLPEPRLIRLDAAGTRVVVRAWGVGPAVVLLHGWGGNSAQLAAFVAPLAARGFSVLALDAPGHGDSGGRRSSLPEFAAALRAIGTALGPIHAVVAHSLGAAATALAMHRGLSVGRAVFLGPPRDPVDWTRQFARQLGIADDVLGLMQARTERRLGFSWEELNVPAIARDLEAPLLVLHDRDDREVPWSDGHAIASAWPSARLLTTAGLGHQRILRDGDVVERVTAFVAGESIAASPVGWPAACPRPGCQRPAMACGLCLACGFERELFERDGRGLRLAV